jgi:hypothetical protein
MASSGGGQRSGRSGIRPLDNVPPQIAAFSFLSGTTPARAQGASMRTICLIGVIITVTTVLPGTLCAATIKCGGTGGHNTDRLFCKDNEYVVGITVRGGSYVDSIGIQCASFTSRGVRNPPGGFRVGGGDGGSTTGNDQCGKDQAVTSITTKAGIYVDRITGGLCGKRTGSNGFADFNPNLAGSDLALSVGGSGGSPCDLTCPQGEAIGAVIVNFGSWTDRIQILCKR